MANAYVNISGDPVEILHCIKNITIGFVWIQVMMLLCFFLGMPAHSWLLWLFLRNGWKIKPTQVFPLILTVMDLLFCLHLSFEALNIFIIQNEVVAYVSLFSFGLSWGCRLLIQVCICIEQYLAVIHPVTFIRYKAIQYRAASAAGVWLVSSGYGLFLAIAKVDFPDCIFLSVCFIGLMVISFCCMSVLRALKHPGPGEREFTKERGRDVGNQQKRNAFKAIFTVLLTVVFSYLPPASITIFHLIKTAKEFFDCDIAFTMLSFHVYCVMFPPLLKLYKQGPLKCMQIVFLKLLKFNCFNIQTSTNLSFVPDIHTYV